MKKWLWALVGVIVIAVVIGLFVHQKRAKQSEIIKIGAILPLTGDFAFFGEEIKKGIEIGIEKMKVIHPDLRVVVLYEDDQSLSPVAAVNAANKLIKADKVDCGVTMIVEESRPIAPIFNKNKIPLLVLWDSNEFIRSAGEYIFSNGFSTEKAGILMAQFAYNNLKIRNVAVVKHVDPWAEIISKSFRQEFERLGGNVISEETVSPDEKDYRKIVADLKKENPEGIYFALVPPNSALFLIQAKQMGLSSIFLTGDAFIPDVITAAGSASEGVFFTNIYTEKKEASEIRKLYKNKFGNEPVDVTIVSFGYDGIQKIIEAYYYGKGDIYKGLKMLFGPNRSADRVEKIFKVESSKPLKIKEVE